MKTEQQNDELFFSHYLVAFIDLLGQREELKHIGELPDPSDEAATNEFLKSAKRTIGKVLSLQDDATSYFDSFKTKHLNSPINELINFPELQLQFQRFSDGLVAYVPLHDNNNDALTGVYSLLAMTGLLIPLQLAKESPIRIGISLDVGIELNPGEIYGKALADAYEMESEIAQYPRAVASESLIKYLMHFVKTKCKDNDFQCKYKQAMADTCINLLSRDFDGYLIVDYLSSRFSQKTQFKHDEMHKLAYNFTESELKKFQEQRNSKLALRYNALYAYFSQKFPS